MKIKILNQLNKIIKKNYTRFHMPGHKGRSMYKFDWYKYDFTEVAGSDNLSNPEGIINEVLNDISKIYDTHKSYILVNGSTVGIISSLLAVCKPEESFIIPRNSHRSVYSALILNNIVPVYLQPNYDHKYTYPVSIDPFEVEKVFIENPLCKGIIITSPTYYGTCSDINKISQITKKYSKILIVDEAHGAHLKFNNNYPISAVEQGADIVIQSTHKHLNSFTQTGILHVCNESIDLSEISKYINMLQSSSPSYPMMISIEMAVKHAYTKGKGILDNIIYYYDMIEKELEDTPFTMIGSDIINNKEVYDYDKSKIWINSLISGKLLDRILRENYNIQVEMSDNNSILGMMGMGTKEKDVTILIRALKEIAEDMKYNKYNNSKKINMKYPITESRMIPWETMKYTKRKIDIQEAKNKIAGDFIIPYPPGVPLIIPGEIINEEVLEYLMNFDKKDIVGVSESNLISILDA
ncbi:MAG: aminotransferase class I/II-fold pyridoxal phosphate-dependent enzyme [Eubacteriaceae bacterium]